MDKGTKAWLGARRIVRLKKRRDRQKNENGGHLVAAWQHAHFGKLQWSGAHCLQDMQVDPKSIRELSRMDSGTSGRYVVMI